MKPKHGPLFSLILVACTTGCAALDPLSAEMSAWQGDNVSAAIERWGTPEEQRAFGQETVLIWRDRVTYYPPAAHPFSADDATVLCERMLAVADDGTITGWRWRGDACASLDAELRTRTLAASR